MLDAPIVTLATDWSMTDFFLGKVKAMLFTSIPGVRVVDVSHGLGRFDLSASAMVVKHGCMNFPADTIHIIDFDSSSLADVTSIVVRYNRQYFIMPDNGLPILVFGKNNVEAYTLSAFQVPEFQNNMVCDVYCKVAAMIAAGSQLSEFGEPYEQLKSCLLYDWSLQDNKIRAYISYIDSYGNANLNITYTDFEQIRQGRRFRLMVSGQIITELHKNYYVTNSSGLLLLTVSSSGQLQIAVNHGNASNLLGLQVMQMVVIVFQ